jgi:hypothetical protein
MWALLRGAACKWHKALAAERKHRLPETQRLSSTFCARWPSPGMTAPNLLARSRGYRGLVNNLCCWEVQPSYYTKSGVRHIKQGNTRRLHTLATYNNHQHKKGEGKHPKHQSHANAQIQGSEGNVLYNQPPSRYQTFIPNRDFKPSDLQKPCTHSSEI